MLEAIMDRRNVEKALLQVERNKGVGGVDGMQTDELRDYLNTHYQQLRREVMAGIYKSSPVKKVEIPKPQGGVRMLGIPTVIDRLLQQSISRWMNQFYEPYFSAFSYGFRPNKNAHQAVLQAQTFLNEGKSYVIELDLEKFFDKVNHDKLMGLLMRKITDKATLQLIRQYLRSGIMEDGVVSQRIEGTPQGSPLSPLLSNIILDELDKELSKRGLSFVRYADDCSIYVRSEKSAQRVLASITHYIEKDLKLKVNKAKSKVSRPTESTLLGFSFYKSKGEWEIRIAKKTIERIREKSKTITKRNNGSNTRQKVLKIQALVQGWVNYFSIAKAKSVMQNLDALVRSRLRMGLWKEWKWCKTRVANLLKLKASKQKSYEWGNSSRGYCRVARSPILCTTLNNAYFTKQGYIGFYETYLRLTNATQPSLF
ncbi:group II intron reverse transcriptase/maturase [Marivirga sp.]|uniref:group II intron reverse transcriptase/maturase n=1 Tax=Marivirga sp. TaxID=2018662 RepID=UPI002D7FF223|nr:group II intron reverse transcriptase/maturase [Marivirga sp.]HET8860062.1 group II intron reverse transcriptase/maturase [Marivirga sp.]